MSTFRGESAFDPIPPIPPVHAVFKAPAATVYPGSHSLANPIDEVAKQLAAAKAASFYLDTTSDMGNQLDLHGEDHHQGIARTHRLSDGSVQWFLTQSHIGGHGVLASFRDAGPLDAEHIQQTKPLTIAAMTQQLKLSDQHPSDLVFLPEVNYADSGYLFVTEEYDNKTVRVYRWSPASGLTPTGTTMSAFANQPGNTQGHGPNFVFLDLVGDTYYFGAASNNLGVCLLWRAPAASLFPTSQPGSANLEAFVAVPGPGPGGTFTFPLVGDPSQCKLVRDSTGAWFLLAFRSVPDDDPKGTDYLDVYPVGWSPFSIGLRLPNPTHITFPSGDTGFASTGTIYVEPSGRALLSSSYRWAEDEAPNGNYVSRVDELAAGVNR